MDLMMSLIFLGFITSGIIIGYPIGVVVDRKRFHKRVEIAAANISKEVSTAVNIHLPNYAKCAEREHILEAEVIE